MSHDLHIYRQLRSIARQHADRVAVTFRDASGWREWSYAELTERAIGIGEQLADLGVGRGHAVGLIGHRRPDTIAAMLGILDVGAHFVPVDPIQPAARAKLLLETAGAELVVATSEVDGDGAPVSIAAVGAAEVSTRRVPPTKSDVAHESPEDVAYVMFTSGSTGSPKGVLVPHRAITRLVADQDYVRFDSSRVFLHAASMGFDASTFEIWGPLLHGGRCVLYPSGALSTAEGLRDVISATGVTTAWLTASLFHAIVDHDVQSLAGLAELVVGGESLSVPHVHKALTELNGTQLVNGYGPTENTTFSACYRIPKDLSRTAPRVPIGRAIRGTQLVVVDEALRPVEAGTEGELVAMGDGLALGYLDEHGLVSERFVDLVCPDGVTRRGYRTGDRVVELPDGLLDFLGRRDDQVKIHGNRIEPAEVEAVIAGLSEVSQCRVVTQPGPRGQVRLVAYVVLCERGTLAGLKQAMADVLPVFMVPHYVVALPDLPLNANGKLATESLPVPWPATRATAAASRRTGHLALVEQAWAEVLGFPPESSDVNFFDAGGRSLDATMLHGLLERRLKLTLEPTFAFEFPTAGRQASELTVLLAKVGASPQELSGGSAYDSDS